jgi:hypothetical protein
MKFSLSSCSSLVRFVQASSLLLVVLGALPILCSAAPSQQYLLAGLRNSDGSAHKMPEAHKVTGKSISVATFGADPADNGLDDRPAIEKALASAQPGDEVFFPNGSYLLASPSSAEANANIILKTGVNLRGESEAGVRLITTADSKDKSKPFTVIRGVGVNDILLSNLTVSSTWKGQYSTSASVNNPDRGGPSTVISISGNEAHFSFNIIISHVTVEKFVRCGIQIGRGSYDCIIRECTAQNASDTGNGGAGYGFTVQAASHKNAETNPYLNTHLDTQFILVEKCLAKGPYIRHGYLLQNWAHNCAFLSNTALANVLDAIDFHGEDEYLNEVAYNTVEGSGESGVGIGNGGATHDKAGPWNWIHHNKLSGCYAGVSAGWGTLENAIEDNIIENCAESPKGRNYGINLNSVLGFLVRRNIIRDNKAKDFIGIRLALGKKENDSPEGVPTACVIEDNVITNNTGKAVLISAEGPGNQWKGNRASGNADNTLPAQN